MTHSPIFWCSLSLLCSFHLSHMLSVFLHLYFSVFFSPFLSCSLSLLPSFQAWLNGDNMFRGDKQAHAAAEGSLGKAMVVCAVACVATRGPDKSPAVGGRDCLCHIIFRDIQCVSQCRWSVFGWMARCPQDCTSCLQITAVICKHWHMKTLHASLQRGWITGRGSNCNQGQACYAQRCWL